MKTGFDGSTKQPEHQQESEDLPWLKRQRCEFIRAEALWKIRALNTSQRIYPSKCAKSAEFSKAMLEKVIIISRAVFQKVV